MKKRENEREEGWDECYFERSFFYFIHTFGVCTTIIRNIMMTTKQEGKSASYWWMRWWCFDTNARALWSLKAKRRREVKIKWAKSKREREKKMDECTVRVDSN